MPTVLRPLVRRSLVALGFIVSISSIFHAAADESSEDLYGTQPYRVSNLHAFTQFFGLPMLNTPVAPESGYRIKINQEISNHSSSNAKGSEKITVDGETWRTTLDLDFNLYRGLQVGLTLPYVSQSEGVMDSFIMDWHEAFGLPQGGRTRATNDQLKYAYSRDGTTLENFDTKSSGLGDISGRLLYHWNLNHRILSLQADLKAGTGDAQKFLGGGANDYSLGAFFIDPTSLANRKISYYVGGAVTKTGKVDRPISQYQEDYIGSFRSGFNWQFSRPVGLKIQLDGHTAPYQSQTKELGQSAVQLSFGGDFRINQAWQLDVAVIEDIVTISSPDVIFLASLSYTPKSR